MKIRPSKPSQPRFVAMNGQSYAWDAAKGLDPSVALEVAGFVRKRASRYASRATLAGLEFDDLVQEGMAGALKAAAKYNPEVGASYLTYAVWWIEAAMKDAMTRQIIRTPQGEAFARVESLDAPIGGEGDGVGQTFLDWQCADQPDAHDLFSAEEARGRMKKALPKLNPRDREVLARHAGLDGHHPRALHEVAKDLGVTRQRVGQILVRARKDLLQELSRGRNAS